MSSWDSGPLADPSLMYQWLRPGVVPPPTQAPAAGGALPPASSVPPDPTTGAGLGMPGMWNEQPPTNLPMRGAGGLLGRLFGGMPGATGTGAGLNTGNMTSPAGLGAIALAGLAGGLRGSQGQQQPPGLATISGGGPLRQLPTLPGPPMLGRPQNAGSFQQGGIVPQTGLYQVQGGEQVIPRKKVAKLHQGELVVPPRYMGSYQEGGYIPAPADPENVGRILRGLPPINRADPGTYPPAGPPIYDRGMSSPNVQNQPGARSMYDLMRTSPALIAQATRQLPATTQSPAQASGLVSPGIQGQTPATQTAPFVGDPLNYPKVPQAIMPTGAEKGPAQYAQPFTPNTETQFVNKAARAQAITSNLIGGIGQAVMTYKQMEWDKRMQQARNAGLQQAGQLQQQQGEQQGGQPGQQRQPDKSLQYLQAALQAAPNPKAKQDIQKQIEKYQKRQAQDQMKQNKQMAKVWENAQKPNSPEWFGMQQARQDLYAQQLTQANIEEAQQKALLQKEQLRQMQENINITTPAGQIVSVPRSMIGKVVPGLLGAEAKMYGIDQTMKEKYAAIGYRVNDKTGDIEQIPENELPVPQQQKIRLQQAQMEYDKARTDALANPNSPAFRLKVWEAQSKINLLKASVQIREERMNLALGVVGEKTYQPAMDADTRLLTMRENYRAALQGDQQAMLSLLSNHIGMTMGLQKGARITQAIYHEAESSAPWLQKIQAKFDQDGYLSGVTLTPAQMQQMVGLAEALRPMMWQKARDQARTFNLGMTEPDPLPGLDRVPDTAGAPLAPLPGLTTPSRGQPPAAPTSPKGSDPAGIR